MNNLKDEEIIKRISSPDQRENDKAFKSIYENHYSVIEKFILANSGKLTDAEDIFQDALVVIFHQIKSQSLKLTCSLQTYIYSICRNLWLKKLRKNNRMTQLSDTITQHISVKENALETLVDEEQGQLIGQMLSQIGKDCKAVLMFFYFEKLKMVEIAQRMDLANEQVAKNKKSICLKKLKSLFNSSDFFKKNLDLLK